MKGPDRVNDDEPHDVVTGFERWVPTGALQIPRSGTRVVALGLHSSCVACPFTHLEYLESSAHTSSCLEKMARGLYT